MHPFKKNVWEEYPSMKKKINARYDPAGADADFLFKVAIEGTQVDIKEHTVLRCTFG